MISNENKCQNEKKIKQSDESVNKFSIIRDLFHFFDVFWLLFTKIDCRLDVFGVCLGGIT